MKKIMFNDKYGLTQAVLEGRKTMTRRVVNIHDADEVGIWDAPYITIYKDGRMLTDIMPTYKVGEEVAVAQTYIEVYNQYGDWLEKRCEEIYTSPKALSGVAGWTNKMFVKADLMPHRIRITNIKVERLQDISDEDVYKEGFRHEFVNNGWGNYANHEEAVLVYYDNVGRTKVISSRNPKEAFSFLIDKISGKGTWGRDPWVFAYTFELVR